ncbi:MAG: hypothetical protein JW993_00085 [Sedimentisphaerales bacterium]|nr:hypothetical protein [Sedimentisphaerales bacterium]
MITGSVPRILFSDWLWWAILAVVLALAFLLRKRYPRPSPEISNFLVRHRGTIARVIDIALIIAVLFWSPLLFDAIRGFRQARAGATEPPLSLAQALSMSLVMVAVWSGFVAPFLGCLSVFRFRITTPKRIVLLILCLLPMIFATVALLFSPVEDRRPVAQLGALVCVPTWIANGSRALTGRPLVEVIRRIIPKLRDSAEGRGD